MNRKRKKNFHITWRWYLNWMSKQTKCCVCSIEVFKFFFVFVSKSERMISRVAEWFYMLLLLTGSRNRSVDSENEINVFFFFSFKMQFVSIAKTSFLYYFKENIDQPSMFKSIVYRSFQWHFFFLAISFSMGWL